MEEKKLELLAPAGSFEGLKAAVCAGADAVYMGGAKFGARAYADNPDGEELLKAIDYAHLYGVKFYLTVNTLLKERELTGELYDYLRPCYEHGLDAVLVQDIGVLRAIRRWFPDLPVHASTQMTVCGADGVRFLEELGVARVVLARELSLDEIRAIHDRTDAELECFVHGALCYCYSGQCLFSSILGGRSGNRGRCAQPCRLSYEALADGQLLSKKEEGALLSPKDICALDLLPQIIEAGACSFKIEGRMKRPEYAAGVVRIYRKYLDQYIRHGAKGCRVSEEDRQELALLFNRGGFSRGYYEKHNGRDLMALKSAPPTDRKKQEYENLIASLKKSYIDDEKKLPLRGRFYARAGERMRLELKTADGRALTVYGDIPQIPQNLPMAEAQFQKQLEKTGNTPFVWEHLEVKLDGPLFAPLQALNALRREALDRMKEKIVSSCCRQGAGYPDGPHRPQFPRNDGSPVLHISVETAEQLETVLRLTDRLKQCEKAPLAAVYADAESMEEELTDAVERIHARGLEALVILPAVFRESTAKRYRNAEKFWTGLPADGYVIKNPAEYMFLREISWKKAVISDHNVYTFNRESREFWRGKGISMQTNPLELNCRELEDISAADSIQILYGRYPMMVTAGCLHKTLNRCAHKPEVWTLRDRFRKEFPVKNYCRDCYNVIYNSQPLYLFDRMEELERLGVGAYRIMFTAEEPGEVCRALSEWLEYGKPRIQYTRGHFKRGVE